MTEVTKNFWTTKRVSSYYENLQKGKSLVLPNDAYCTKNFTWNEVLRTNNKFYQSAPSYEILENIKSMTNVLQVYRDAICKPIVITSSLRTKEEQEYLKKNCYKPSNTSLHLEGLAMDFVVIGADLKYVQSFLDKVHFGEVEFGHNYTHISLPTYSKKYLSNKNLYINKLYKKISLDGFSVNSFEKRQIIKRFYESDTQKLVQDHFSIEENRKLFANFKV